MIGQTIAQYEIVSRLGRGGMGEVFLARDTRLRRRVALKTLSSELQSDTPTRDRLLAEARAAAAIDHPYVCKIYDVGEVDGLTFIAMEYVEGKTLARRLQSGPMEIDEVVAIALEVSEALSYAHRAGVVHRDLKPANLMLASGGHVKVMDFGLAKQISLPEGSQTISHVALSGQGAVVGTLDYAAPEQLCGEPVDPRCDLFFTRRGLLSDAGWRESVHAADAGRVGGRDPG